MCGRFTLTRDDLDELAEALQAEVEPGAAALYRPRFNVAPTDQHWIVKVAAGRRRLAPATWGFAVPGRPPLINARAESAASRPAFRAAFRDGRCLVPADGFYEWTGPARRRRPVWFHRPDRQLLLFAGLFEEAAGRPRFTILTTAASADVAGVHDRMPLVLTAEQAPAWLAEGRAPAQAAGLLVGTEVSPRVNAVANDDAALLAPVTEDPGGQRRLF